eukprot:223974-Rhodomonas_salina.1
MAWCTVLGIDETEDPFQYTISVSGKQRVTTRDRLFVPKDDRFEPDDVGEEEPEDDEEADNSDDDGGTASQKKRGRQKKSKPAQGFVGVDDPEYEDHSLIPDAVEMEEYSATVSKCKGDIDIDFYQPRIEQFITICTHAGAA